MAKKIVYLYETGNSIDAWTVPADWNSSDNTIECIGGGASGRNYNNGVWTGAGGGGGAYSKIANLTLTPGDSIAYSVGIHGQPDNPSSTSGKDTWFNGANLAGASVGAQAGQGPDNSSTGAGGAGGAASSGIGSTKYSGGSGGSSAGNYYRGNGAGGGAAGPNGDGGNGGSAFIGPPSAQSGGGGGGGSNGAGGTASTAYPGSAGVGGGNPSAAGVDGSNASGAAGPNGTPAAGGNGGASPYGVGGAGGNGTEWDLAHGAGAGGGGAANFATPVGGGPGGNYGGGGGSGDNGFSGYGSPGLIVIAYSPLLTPPQGWLVVYETSGSPAVGSFAIRSNPQGGPGAEYLYLGQGTQHSFNLQLRQRGQAQYSLVVAATDSYAPTQFQPVFLYDQTSAGYTLVFSGILLDYTIRQIGINGDRYIDCNAASLEALLDTVYVTQSMQFVNQTCGSILTTLFNAFETGAIIGLGTIQSGASIPLFNAPIGAKLSEIFDQLATTSEFVWGVNPQTQLLYFQIPTTTAAPFSITSSKALWDSISNKLTGSDYRNRQGVRLSYDAFPHSMEFFQGSNQQTITLARPVKQVVNAYVTLSTPNTATGSFSGQPSSGDTITIGPAAGTWQASHVYATGGPIVFNGYVFVVTGAGTSGSSLPDFSSNLVTGDTVTDNTVIWTCQGALGLGTGQTTYTFVGDVDNTQFGQVLIGSNLAVSVQNLVDAINATVTRSGNQLRGVTYSLPTWENSQVNAIGVTGTGFTVQQKAAGTGWVAALSQTGTAFSWSAAITSGGTSPQGSLGPNEGATITIQVYQQGTSTASPGLAYTEGSAVVSLATPLNVGSNLNVEYTREDGDVIEVERTDLVNALAVTTGGTGKVQQFTDQSQQGLISTSALAGLQLAQQALAAYDVPPTEIEIEVLQPGLFPGQQITLALNGYWSILNGNYFIEEVQAQLIPVDPYLDSTPAPGAGHYRYKVKLINTAQIGSYMDFWEGMGSGIGGGSGGAVVATSGGAVSSTANVPVSGGVNAQTTSYAAVAADNGKIISVNAAGATTLTLPAAPPSTQWNIFVENIGAGTLTVSPNGLDIDGSGSSLTLATNQGVYLSTDGTNYFTERGIGGGLTNPMTTKGDVIVGATSGVPARLAVGTDGQVPTANSSATDGVDWEAPIALTTTGTSGAASLTPGNPYVLNVPQYSGGGGGGDLTQIAQSILGGASASVTFSSIPGTFTQLMLIIIGRSSVSALSDNILMQLNGDTGANYDYEQMDSNETIAPASSQATAQTSTSAVGVVTGATATANQPGSVEITFPGYSGTAFSKTMHAVGWLNRSTSSATSKYVIVTSAHWRSTAAINAINIFLASGANFIAGSSFTLYGLK